MRARQQPTSQPPGDGSTCCSNCSNGCTSGTAGNNSCAACPTTLGAQDTFPATHVYNDQTLYPTVIGGKHTLRRRASC
eukprot:4701507-Amphidinium_carterae.2